MKDTEVKILEDPKWLRAEQFYGNIQFDFPVGATRWRRHDDWEGNIWLEPLMANNAGSFVHVWKRRGKHEGPYAGYAGSTLHFIMEDGSTLDLQGPWHSNSGALKAATGVDLTNTHQTVGCIALKRGVGELPDYRFIYSDIVHMDNGAVVGTFERLRDMAQEIANKTGLRVWYYCRSSGGAAHSWCMPKKRVS